MAPADGGSRRLHAPDTVGGSRSSTCYRLRFYRYTRNRHERNVTITGSWAGTSEERLAATAFAYLRESPLDNPSGTFGEAG